ncbi:hypothetical protein [Saccharibacillus deserti]|uniref:hypothetical protein n=1 Tax=Saccharibacillus deserti TaxID=1634444 RepID=UPI00155262F3|nr:hypothetical protein [Saccharibacillus deserti]
MNIYSLNGSVFSNANTEGVFILSPTGETLILKDDVSCSIFNEFKKDNSVSLEQISEVVRRNFKISIEEEEFQKDISEFVEVLLQHQIIQVMSL